jgi:ATP synthase protein I
MRTLDTGPPGITVFDKRHKPPVKPMDVAFLVPEASKMDETAVSRGSSTSVVLRVLMAQIGIGVVLAAVLWGFYGHVAGYSALLGALTCVLPNGFLALRLAVPRRDPGARALIQAAYIGELGKLGLTVLMFSIVFLLVRPLAVAPLFAGFIAAQLMTFAGLLMRDKTGTEQTNETVNGE